MPQTRSQTQATIGFPKKKLSNTLKKPNSRDCEVKLRNVQPVPTTPCVDVKLLPLSPRKRLGDDNLCNTPRLSPCSPPKLGKKENGPPRSHTWKGCRLVFDDEPTFKASPQKNKTEFANTRYVPPPLKEVQRAKQILSRNVRRRRSLCV